VVERVCPERQETIVAKHNPQLNRLATLRIFLVDTVFFL